MTEFDATRMVNVYRSLKKPNELSPSMTSMVIKACAEALRENEEINAALEGDEIKIMEEINIAVAVDTPRGLYAPVVRNADRLSLIQIEKELSRLREKAMDGSLALTDISDHTFTVSNLGPEGVYFFTPIINPPAICILGVGAIVRKPVAVGDAVEIREVGHLSLVFDHRAGDGAPAARFLAMVKNLLENFRHDA